MCANSTSKIISPIRSRCLLVRVAAPEEEEVRRVSLPGDTFIARSKADTKYLIIENPAGILDDQSPQTRG
jgi:DNA polymerase III delta prime subunit